MADYVMTIFKINQINDEGYYIGPEVQWNLEDVEVIAARKFKLELSEEDLKRVLIASIQDNEWLMERFQQAIEDTIDYMINEGELKL